MSWSEGECISDTDLVVVGPDMANISKDGCIISYAYHIPGTSNIRIRYKRFGTPEYICSDANGDGSVNVGDAVFLISYVFKGGAAPNPVCVGDANGDGSTNVGDAVYLINYVFKGGAPPVETCCP